MGVGCFVISTGGMGGLYLARFDPTTYRRSTALFAAS
jgi:hypothetical protein